MGKEGHKQQDFQLYIRFIITIFMVLCLSFGIISPLAYTENMHLAHALSNPCPTAKAPTNSSLLVIILDRSASVKQTDPAGYATSDTKALIDLWPGPIAVIPFSGNGSKIPVLGPASVDFILRTALKNQVDRYPIGGNTPLNLAMRQTLSLLRKAPSGSRAIVISDGQPTGSGKENTQQQEQDIRQNLIPQFCSQGTPVNAFGLMIDTSTPSGRDADHLLTDINNGTGAGATYNHVENPKELASSIIGLYANWLDLDFSPLTLDGNGIYPLSIDAFAQKISVITFRANNNRTIALFSPDEQKIQGVQTSAPPDRHYEIDSIEVIPPIIPGIYKVDAGTDPDTQVYALVTSPLHVKIIYPTPNTSILINQSIQIQTTLYDGQNQLTPASNQAQVRAYVTLTVKGKTVGNVAEIDLKQQGNIFSNQTSEYTQAGVLNIEVRATYRGANRETSVSIPLVQLPIITQQTPFSWGLVVGVLLVLGVLIILLLLTKLKKQRSRKPYLQNRRTIFE